MDDLSSSTAAAAAASSSSSSAESSSSSYGYDAVAWNQVATVETKTLKAEVFFGKDIYALHCMICGVSIPHGDGLVHHVRRKRCATTNVFDAEDVKKFKNEINTLFLNAKSSLKHIHASMSEERAKTLCECVQQPSTSEYRQCLQCYSLFSSANSFRAHVSVMHRESAGAYRKVNGSKVMRLCNGSTRLVAEYTTITRQPDRKVNDGECEANTNCTTNKQVFLEKVNVTSAKAANIIYPKISDFKVAIMDGTSKKKTLSDFVGIPEGTKLKEFNTFRESFGLDFENEEAAKFAYNMLDTATFTMLTVDDCHNFLVTSNNQIYLVGIALRQKIFNAIFRDLSEEEDNDKKHTICILSEATLRDYSRTLLAFCVFVVKTYELQELLEAVSPDSFIKLIYIIFFCLQQQSFVASSILKMFLKAYSLTMINSKLTFVKVGTMQKYVRHILRSIQMAVLVNTAFSTSYANDLEREQSLNQYRRSSFYVEAIATSSFLRYHDMLCTIGQQITSPHFDVDGKFNGVLLHFCNNVLTPLAMNLAASKLAHTCRKSLEALAVEQKINISLDFYNYNDVILCDNENFFGMENWNTFVLSITDYPIFAFLDLIALMHVRNGPPPREEDYSAMNKRCFTLGSCNELKLELSVLKRMARVKSSFFSLDPETAHFAYFLFFFYGFPSSEDLLGYNFKDQLSARLSAAFDIQIDVAQYRKVADTFASLCLSQTKRSDDAVMQRLTNMLETMSGHTAATNRGIHYANLNELSCGVASPCWRKYALLMPDEVMRSTLDVRKIQTSKSVLNDFISSLCSTCDEEKRSDLQVMLEHCVNVDFRKIVCYHTCGFGKSNSFIVHGSVLHKYKELHASCELYILVVVPTKALVKNFMESEHIKAFPCKIACWENKTVGFDILFVCPESVIANKEYFNGGKNVLAVYFDEFHERVESTYRYSFAYMFGLFHACVPVRVLTGSIPSKMRQAFLDSIGWTKEDVIQLGTSCKIVNCKISYFVKELFALRDVAALISDLLSKNPSSKVLVLVLTVNMVKEMSHMLGQQLANDFKTTISTATREKETFTADFCSSDLTCRICIATSLFSTGVTAPLCDFVVNIGCYSLANLIQSAGRAGRGKYYHNRPCPEHHLVLLKNDWESVVGAPGTKKRQDFDDTAVCGFSSLCYQQKARRYYGPSSVEGYFAQRTCLLVYLQNLFDDVSAKVCGRCSICLLSSLHEVHFEVKSSETVIENVDFSNQRLTATRQLLEIVNNSCVYCGAKACNAECSKRIHASNLPHGHPRCFRCGHAHGTKFCDDLAFRNKRLQICANCYIPLGLLSDCYLTSSNKTSSLYSARIEPRSFGQESTGTQGFYDLDAHKAVCVGKNRAARDRLRAVIIHAIVCGEWSDEEKERLFGEECVRAESLTKVQMFWKRVQNNLVPDMLNLNVLAMGASMVLKKS